MKNNILPLVLAIAGSGGSAAGAFTYKGSCNFENLPTTDLNAGDVYDILNDFTLGGKHYPAGTNVAWTGEAWDPLGGNVDLSNIYTKTETNSLLNAKQNSLTAGDNIVIEDDVISALPGIHMRVQDGKLIIEGVDDNE